MPLPVDSAGLSRLVVAAEESFAAAAWCLLALVVFRLFNRVHIALVVPETMSVMQLDEMDRRDD
ncbi:hypothetical protein NZK35_28245 [Stieleria sp. ICT_E10.1]|uniref:hypothetical protein n=1 Tax=Stieleria sedimenti TaxID=2976331 RepID=UPI00217F2B6F|nr:hypothetical protein [Stieleria sedimenti]MCS7470561.1 hypothetical protein [Stieleria sedimenti]